MNAPDLTAGVDVDRIAGAVGSCPGVAGLAEGAAASVESYLPGRRIAGIRIRDDYAEIQVCARWGVPAGEVAHQVRAATAPLVGNRRVDVTIADIADPPGWEESSTWTNRPDAAHDAPTSVSTTRTGAATPPRS